ncbi:MAG: chemotaxis protein CheA [Verrucomicrobiales bacterium]|nr:chemotaxis protein CheA [Verrucomicrobiales bacterium]
MGPPGQGPADAALARLIAQIGLELAVAKPGQDDGLLPVNSLLGEIEEIGQTLPVSGELREAVAGARGAVEAAFETGAFTAEGLARLRAWTVGMQRALATAGETPAPQHPTAAGEMPAPQAGAGEELCLDPAQDAEMLRAFLDESREHLHQIEQGVLALERNPQEAATLHAIFRAFHTMKGGAGFLHLGPIQALAHELESLLQEARQGRMAMDAAAIELILTGSDRLGRWVGELEAQLEGAKPPGPIRMPMGDLIERIRERSLGRGAGAEAPAAPKSGEVAGAPGARETDACRLEARTTGEGQGALPTGARLGGTEGKRQAAGRVGTQFVRVNTQKLDALVDLVGELVIAQSLVTGDVGVRALEDPGLSRHRSQLGRVTAELQRTAMALRLVPIRATFEKMARLVRDLSLKAGKQVELQLQGEDTELDRHLIDELDDPLVHMIRNAVDHGIEPPAVRVAQGKPPRGVIALAASHRAGHVVIEVRDDGAGLDRERIVAKARRQGLIGEGENPGEAEVLRLLFTPGFSTAERVTEISGRGVGMDVVWRNITDLRGQVTADSVRGQGTTFAIHLPLTLAIIDGLLVGVGGQRFVLPTLAVRESFRPTREMVSRAGPRGEVVNVRGRLCPLLRLHEHLGIEPRTKDPTEAVVVVVESNREQRCVMVDELLGKQEVVIKGLGERFRHNRVLAGAAILGDGQVGLILEADALVRPRDTRGREANG